MVTNMQTSKGNPAVNQFLITTDNLSIYKSYKSIIVAINRQTGVVQLDKHYWNYSHTTTEYRNIFLSENTQTTLKKIESGEYILTNLNAGAM